MRFQKHPYESIFEDPLKKINLTPIDDGTRFLRWKEFAESLEDQKLFLGRSALGKGLALKKVDQEDSEE